MGLGSKRKVGGENLKLRPSRKILVLLGLEKQLKIQHITSQGHHFLLSGVKGSIGIISIVGMDFKKFGMVLGVNVGIRIQIHVIGTHGHQQYLEQPPNTSQAFPHLQLVIQVPLEHFAY